MHHHQYCPNVGPLIGECVFWKFFPGRGQRTQLRLLAGTVRAEGDENAVALQEVQGMRDVRNVGAIVKGRVHQNFVEAAELLDGACQEIRTERFTVGQQAGRQDIAEGAIDLDRVDLRRWLRVDNCVEQVAGAGASWLSR